MEDSVTVEIERTPPLLAERPFFVQDDVFTGVLGTTITRQRIACGSGCGFVVNVN